MIACFDRCVELALATVDAPEECDMRALRARMEEELNAAAVAAEKRADKPAAYRARRMATAWVDERLAVDPWPGREEWVAHPLQSDWEEGRTAGEWFFDTLADLDPARPHHADLAALALRLMSFGFDGRMYRSPDEIVRLRQTLSARFGLAHPLFPFPPVIDVPAGGRRPRWREFVRLSWILPLLAGAALIPIVRYLNACLEAAP